MIEQCLCVTGMTCDHCAAAVEKALLGVAGVTRAEASYIEGRVRVSIIAGTRIADLPAAVCAQGFGAILLEDVGRVPIPPQAAMPCPLIKSRAVH